MESLIVERVDFYQDVEKCHVFDQMREEDALHVIAALTTMKGWSITVNEATQSARKIEAAYKGPFKAEYTVKDDIFPEGEYVSFDKILAYKETHNAEVLAITDDGTPVGFMVFLPIPNTEWLYLLYFAVDSSRRGCNYGSRALKLMKERYAGKQVFGSIETLLPDSGNYDQRVTRWRFYKRNGFCFSDITYTIPRSPLGTMTLITTEKIDKEQLFDMLTGLLAKMAKVPEEVLREKIVLS